jgi:hypothetical protein
MNSRFFKSGKGHCQFIIPSMLVGCVLLFFSNVEAAQTNRSEQFMCENVGSKRIMFDKGSYATIDRLSIRLAPNPQDF